MTPLRRVVDSLNFETPALFCDLDIISANFQNIKSAMSWATVYYAVKANPAPEILKRLNACGSKFDAASLEEIKLCLANGVLAENISYGNTVKKESAIKEAFSLGVTIFALDSVAELEKIARVAPGSRVYCRLLVNNKGAEWPLSKKFGCSSANAISLMVQAKNLGLIPYGLSFHVGSQQLEPQAYLSALETVEFCLVELKRQGVDILMLNLGGGYPIPYRQEVPSIDVFCQMIGQALSKNIFKDIQDIMIEPGRYLVGNAGVIVTEVVLVAKKDDADDARWVYLDIGRFGGLAETEGEAIQYRVETMDARQDMGLVVIAGPTCDSTDTLYERVQYRLPMDLKSGEKLLIHDTGAYVTTYASQAFNGFTPLTETYIGD